MTTTIPIETKRHSYSHILAQAVLDMFPEAKLGIGPNIDNGFYYDFDLPRTLIPEDLPLLEEKMKKIISEEQVFEHYEEPLEKSIEFLQTIQQPYKVELAKELGDQGEKNVSFYKNGPFVDMCAGPHVSNTKDLNAKAFKLHSIAGAYWRGSEKNKMLQRIYGWAFDTEKELKAHEQMMEEAKKRDHRKLGKELDLFHIDDQVGLGLPLWHPKGAMLWRQIEDFWYKEHLKNGYELVRTPHIGNRSLWETSGHWSFYNSSMYPPLEVGQTLEEKQKNEKAAISEEYLLKPMNCPFHIQIYKNQPRSYRDFPFRWAECGTVYRFEKKGELSGLTRVRGFTQDDAHIICREDQVEDELKRVVDFILFIYRSFGFKLEDVHVYLSTRDVTANKCTGTDEGWDFTEKVLEKIAIEKKLTYEKDVGGAAFYGPKLDFKIKDCLGREWQCSTLQFDFNLPQRFNLLYIDSDGKEKRPYMLHRALFGSFERFIGLLIEHYAGAFPLWLAPVQVRILPVSDKFNTYAEEVNNTLKQYGYRSEIDTNSDTLGKKIRNAEMMKIPHIIVVGEKEQLEKTVTVRYFATKEQAVFSLEEYPSILQKLIILPE